MRFEASTSRCFGVHVEAGILVAVLLAWQAARIPLEGSVDLSLAHATTWHELEGSLGLAGIEDSVISVVYRPDVIDVARWGYSNLHLFAIVAFMLLVRTRAPDRYPPLRSAFVLLHLPALVVIALWPLASPSWLPHPPEWPGNPPTDSELRGSLEATLRNSTAAAVSEHFGYPIFMLAAALWIAPRAPLAWLLALYPPLVLCIIVGTGRHWVLDAIVGALTVALGFACARWLHRSRAPPALPAPEPPVRAIALAVGYALAIDFADALSSTRVSLTHPSPASVGVPILIILAALVAWRR
jgi:PAP2 superfamily